MFKILVCGGRTYGITWVNGVQVPDAKEVNFLNSTLDAIHKETPITNLINGAGNGADMLAIVWTAKNFILTTLFPADWERHGKSAGPIRNKQMLDEGKPDLVVAFAGGRGTANMVKQAMAAGVSVRNTVMENAL